VLESLDITVERVRGQVVRIVGSGEEFTSGQIPFTPRAKKVLERSLREALSFGHNHIGTEHILLGLVRENEGVAARILLDLDADAERIRGETIRMLGGQLNWTAAEGGAEEGFEPCLRWEEATIVWAGADPDDRTQLVVPLHLERRAIALLERADVWQAAPLADVRHEVRRGELRITAPSLLEAIDPRELRRALDDAVAAAHEAAAQARSRDGVLARAFLAALREPGEGEQEK